MSKEPSWLDRQVARADTDAEQLPPWQKPTAAPADADEAVMLPTVPFVPETNPIKRLHNLCDMMGECQECEKPCDGEDDPVVLCNTCFQKLKPVAEPAAPADAPRWTSQEVQREARHLKLDSGLYPDAVAMLNAYAQSLAAAPPADLTGESLDAEPSAWREMASASKVIGTPILVYWPSEFSCPVVAWWTGQRWESDNQTEFQPTHWQPLPLPPTRATKTEAQNG